jgi:hypothetical protein
MLSPCHDPALALRNYFQKDFRGMVRERQGIGMLRVNQTLPHCVNQMGKTQYKALAGQHGRGKAGERHGNRMETA